MGDRQYKVWIKGRRASTETVVSAANKLSAQIRFAGRLGVKSYETDAVWFRPSRREVPVVRIENGEVRSNLRAGDTISADYEIRNGRAVRVSPRTIINRAAGGGDAR